LQLLQLLEAFRDKTLQRVSDTNQALDGLVFEATVRLWSRHDFPASIA
jgi:hypothetical protein